MRSHLEVVRREGHEIREIGVEHYVAPEEDELDVEFFPGAGPGC